MEKTTNRTWNYLFKQAAFPKRSPAEIDQNFYSRLSLHFSSVKNKNAFIPIYRFFLLLFLQFSPRRFKQIFVSYYYYKKRSRDLFPPNIVWLHAFISYLNQIRFSKYYSSVDFDVVGAAPRIFRLYKNKIVIEVFDDPIFLVKSCQNEHHSLTVKKLCLKKRQISYILNEEEKKLLKKEMKKERLRQTNME